MTPAEASLRDDLRAAHFQLAVASGQWQVDQFAFPFVDARLYAPGGSIGMRLEVTDYPARAPAGQPWDLERDVALAVEYWPTGHLADAIFSKSWSPQNGNGLYMPLDRVALESHPDWPNRYGTGCWSTSKSIYDYFAYVHRVLRAATIPARQTS